MALDRSQLNQTLAKSGGPTEEGVRNLLFGAELAHIMDDDENWADMCAFALDVDSAHDISSAYQPYLSSSDRLQSVIEDNYIFAAIAAVKAGVHKRDPLIAWAASNKSEFPGFNNGVSSEIATIRLLLWAGADASMPEPRSSMTALHYLVSVRYGRGSDPRGVKKLLLAGADATLKNKNGDTPMAYLCGISVWGEAQRETFRLLLQAGCDPLAQSNDGATAIDLLKQAQSLSPVEDRQALIVALERDIAGVKPGFFTRMVGAKPPVAWTETLSI